MTGAEAITLIHNRLGQRSGLDAWILTELQSAQASLELAEWLPYFLLEKTAGATVADTQTISPPTGYLRVYENAGLWLVNGTKDVRLVKEDYDVLFKKFGTTDTGVPENYAEVGTTLYVFPVPDAVYVVNYFYYKNDPTAVATGTTNLWLTYAPELMIGFAGAQVATYLRDQEAIALFAQSASARLTQLQRNDTAREVNDRQYEMGG